MSHGFEDTRGGFALPHVTPWACQADVFARAGLRNHQGSALLSSPFINAVVKAIVQTLRLDKAGQLLR